MLFIHNVKECNQQTENEKINYKCKNFPLSEGVRETVAKKGIKT